MDNEIWKQIEGFSRYMVSNMGRIKAKPVIINKRGNGKYLREQKILTGTIDAEGYLHVRLLRDGDKRPILWKIHQLVAKQFLGHDRKNTNNIVVDHINFKKTDNRLQNLRLLDRTYNSKIGCTIKGIERKMPTEYYWYSDETTEDRYYIILNELKDNKTFQHILRDKNIRKTFTIFSKHRMLFEQAIEQFKKIEAII